MAYDDRETGLTVEDRGSKLGLPQNQDAEANVLAAMLLSPEVVEEAQVELQPDDFYRPIHKTIYTAMVDMYNSRIPIDSISLYREIKAEVVVLVGVTAEELAAEAEVEETAEVAEAETAEVETEAAAE